MFVLLFFKYLTFEKAWYALYIKAKEKMVRYLAEPRNILAEPLGSAEPRLKNTALELPSTQVENYCLGLFSLYFDKVIFFYF
jgi:hypothetical protein